MLQPFSDNWTYVFDEYFSTIPSTAKLVSLNKSLHGNMLLEGFVFHKTDSEITMQLWSASFF